VDHNIRNSTVQIYSVPTGNDDTNSKKCGTHFIAVSAASFFLEQREREVFFKSLFLGKSVNYVGRKF